jgi:hypothetical protein
VNIPEIHERDAGGERSQNQQRDKYSEVGFDGNHMPGH